MATKKVLAPMPQSRRAKQFQPFDALRGLKEAIAAKEKVPVPRRYLTNERKIEIGEILKHLQKGQIITAVYYSVLEQNYLQLSGPVSKVDFYTQNLLIGDHSVAFDDIADVVY